MKYITLFLFTVIAHLSANAEVLPTLSAVANPTWQHSAPLADDKFPEYLEKQRDYSGAILEWRRVIYSSSDKNIHKRALYKIAELYNKQGMNEEALAGYQYIHNKYPKDEDVLYQISRLSDLTNREKLGKTARQKLLRINVQSKGLEEAELHHLWHQGIHGADNKSNIFTERGKGLNELLSIYPVETSDLAYKASIYALIPGFGHFHIQAFKLGFFVLALNLCFFWALSTSMKHRHWGYGFAFGALSSLVYVGSMLHAHHLAQKTSLSERIHAMNIHTKLHPKDIQDFNNPNQTQNLSFEDWVEGQLKNVKTNLEKLG